LKNKRLQFTGILLSGILLFCACNEENKPPETEFDKHSFTKEGEIYIVNTEKDTLKHLEVEVAKTAQEQATGLMFRRTMKENRGMIFVYFTERPRYFYMKNTFIPLDLIYVNGENKIVEFNENATPLSEETLPNNIPSQYVLEVNGGKVSEWGLQLNDSLIMHLEE
tara:strand:+ start:197 stop:694 length:498 start_codon:yes stop_codon:yes gene_type:complete